MSKAGLIVYEEDMLSFQLLTTAERGKLITAMIDQHMDVSPKTIDSERLRLVWTQIGPKIESNKQRYLDICNRNRKNRLHGMGIYEEEEDKPPDLTTGDESFTPRDESFTPRDARTKHNITKRNVVSGQEPQHKKTKSVITFDGESGKINITGDECRGVWSRTYPSIDVDRQIELAGVWLMENPRRSKKDLRRFIGNWLRTAQKDADARGDGRFGRVARKTCSGPDLFCGMPPAGAE